MDPARHRPAAGDTVQVDMKDILFVPEKASARVGQTVRWTNSDDVPHTVKAESGADFESKAISKGKTFDAKMTKAGTIDYVCTIHPSQTGRSPSRSRAQARRPKPRSISSAFSPSVPAFGSTPSWTAAP